jgi:type II secretory pathway pseudopilin PulG
VVISIIALLAALAIPAITGGLTRAQLTQALNNARQIYIAAQTMALDSVTDNDPNLGWPGTLLTSGSSVQNVADYVSRLVNYDYLKEGDLKVFACAGVPAAFRLQDFNGGTNCAFKIYAVTEQDSGTAVLLATKNYTYNSALDATLTPFGEKGFVIFRKGGDGSILKRQQAKTIQLVGLLPGETDINTPGSEGQDDFLPMTGTGQISNTP